MPLRWRKPSVELNHGPYQKLVRSGILEDFGVVGSPASAMLSLLWCLLLAARSLFVTQRELALENLALRHQVAVLKRTVGTRRPQGEEPRNNERPFLGKPAPGHRASQPPATLAGTLIASQTPLARP
jgi:hypothetical protein